MEGQLQMVLIAVGVLLVLGILAMIVLVMKRTAYLGPVKEELQKEKLWLRRGEYNAAMVKGRQNLELLLKLVAEKNGIQLDNTAKAQANAREMEERQSQNPRSGKKQKTKSVMTHKEFNRWMTENGYLDRVARWEMHQVRQIGNKAVHENYSDKEDAWNQFNYLEDILKVVIEKSQSPSKRTERTERKGGEEKAAQNPPKKSNSQKKQNPPKAKEAPKKQEQPKKKAAPAPVVAEQATAPVEEPAKKKRRRHRPKKKKTAEGNVTAVVETKKAEPKKPEIPKKPETPKNPDSPKKPNAPKKQPVPKQQEQPKQEQVSAKQEQTKKKNNNNYYWRKRRKKKSSGQANAGTNASAAAAGSGGQK